MLDLAIIPLVVGPCVLPRLRVFEHERRGDESDEVGTVVELGVWEETDVVEVRDPAQVSLEGELKAAREEEGGEVREGARREFVVMVMPR